LWIAIFAASALFSRINALRVRNQTPAAGVRQRGINASLSLCMR